MTNSSDFIPVHTVAFSMLFVPVQVLLGWCANAMNIYVLSRPKLLQASACTHYFLGMAITTFLLICFGPLIQFIQFWYPIQVAIPIVGCPLFAYLYIVLSFEINALLALASWDRFCASSSSTRLRALSSIRRARQNITILTLATVTILSPHLSIWRLNYERGVGSCSQKSSANLKWITLGQTAIYNGLCPLTMVTFGLLTIGNIRQQRLRAARQMRVLSNQFRRRRTEGELCRMLLLQISVYFLTTLPMTIVYVCLIMKPLLRTQSLYFLLHVFHMLYQCTHFINIFVHIASGQIYRREFFSMFVRLKRACLGS